MKASLVVFALGVAGMAHAGFYLPGVAPKSYELRENVRVRVWVRVEGLCAVWRHSVFGAGRGKRNKNAGHRAAHDKRAMPSRRQGASTPAISIDLLAAASPHFQTKPQRRIDPLVDLSLKPRG